MAPKQPKPIESINDIESLETYFKEITQAEFPPSLSVTVIKDNQMVYNKGFGYMNDQGTIPTTQDTIYPWWSTTKLFTATATMKLAEEGLIQLNDPISKYLPEFVVTNKKGDNKDITIKQLLSHQSGLKKMMPQLLKWIHLAGEESPTVTKFYKERILNDYKELTFEPGTKSEYTNTSYIILGVLIEKVTGQTYESYVLENIINPLRMDSTSFVRTPEHELRTAHGSNPMINYYVPLLNIYAEKDFFKDYVRSYREGRFYTKSIYTDFSPSTSLSGTARDLAVFGQTILNRGEYEGRTIFKEDTINQMIIDYDAKSLKDEYNKATLGLGFEAWNVNGNVAYGHGGGGVGYGTIFAIVPEKNTVYAVSGNDTNIDRTLLIKLIDSVEW